MPWNGLGQRLANRNDITQKPITTGMAATPRFKAVDESGNSHTIWAKTLDAAAQYATERGWVIVEETTDKITITTHKPAKMRSTPF
jgi:hypothetical protein